MVYIAYVGDLELLREDKEDGSCLGVGWYELVSSGEWRNRWLDFPGNSESPCPCGSVHEVLCFESLGSSLFLVSLVCRSSGPCEYPGACVRYDPGPGIHCIG